MYASRFTSASRKTRRRQRLVERARRTDEGFRLVFVFACASVVLGISAYLAARLLPYDGAVLGFPIQIPHDL